MSLMEKAIYWDTESLSLNPYEKEGKLVTSQIGYLVDGELEINVLKEWEIGEEKLIIDTINIFRLAPRYTPVFTYNGLHDLMFLIGRMKQYDFDILDYERVHKIIVNHIKHCDLIQYDNGYLVSLDKICNIYDIKSDCVFKGKDILQLYKNKDFNNIIAHGVDDIARLYKLVNDTELGDRFYKVGV